MEKFYRIKHIPTGLYYKTGTNNLSKDGKVYKSGNNVLNYYNDETTVRVELNHNSLAYKKYSTLLKKYIIWNNPVATAYNIPKEDFIKELLHSWEIIPEKKLKSYFGLIPKSNIICDDCNELNEDIPGYPYAYDQEADDIIFAHQCKKCGKILFTRE